MTRGTAPLALLAIVAAGCGSAGSGAASNGAADAAGAADGGTLEEAGGPDAAGAIDDAGSAGSRDGAPDAGTRADASADAATPAAGPGFPRLGSLLIATTSGATNIGYDAGYATWASKIHVNVMGANWVGAGTSLLGGSREALVEAIHAQSKIGARVFQYYVTDQTHEFWPMASVQSWILYQNGTSGPCEQNFY